MGIAQTSQLQNVSFFLFPLGWGVFFPSLRLSEEQDKGASVSSREMKRVHAHFQVESKLGEIKPRFDTLFTFFYLGLGWKTVVHKLKHYRRSKMIAGRYFGSGWG